MLMTILFGECIKNECVICTQRFKLNLNLNCHGIQIKHCNYNQYGDTNQ
jgi:hypothetical protein